MTQVSLLLRAPSANRVYAQAAGALCVAEARWVLGAHLGAVPAVRERTVGGMDALEVERSASVPRAQGGPALAQDVFDALLATLSGTHGVLDVVEEDSAGGAASGTGRPLLRPRALPAVLRHPEDLETIQKYSGKTNEQFTALLINLAAALSSRRAGLLDGSLSLLDPMCGRGTTLHRALRLGLSPVGAEIDAKDVEAHRTFLGTWLRTHRMPHTLTSTRLTVRGEQLGTRTDAELATDRQALRRGEGQRLTLLGCDTVRLGELLPAASVDALVADLPYGVQHGSRAGGSWQRSPLEMLRDAAPGWRRALRAGAGIALAVNRRTLDHDSAREILAENGLHLLSSDGAFRHRVDASIDRDVLLAIPTDHPRAEELTALAAEMEDDTP